MVWARQAASAQFLACQLKLYHFLSYWKAKAYEDVNNESDITVGINFRSTFIYKTVDFANFSSFTKTPHSPWFSFVCLLTPFSLRIFLISPVSYYWCVSGHSRWAAALIYPYCNPHTSLILPRSHSFKYCPYAKDSQTSILPRPLPWTADLNIRFLTTISTWCLTAISNLTWLKPGFWSSVSYPTHPTCQTGFSGPLLLRSKLLESFSLLSQIPFSLTSYLWL